MNIGASTGHSLLLVVVALLLCSTATLTWAQKPALSSKAAKTVGFTLEGKQWYEGERRRTAWLNPQLIAEFLFDTALESQASAPVSEAVLLKRGGPRVRIWRLPIGTHALAALRNLNNEASRSKTYSPVFHDAPSPAARIRALPGNIIVIFRQDVEEVSTNQWMESRDLRFERALATSSAAFVIESGSGLEAMELANRLQGSDEIDAVFPDWWQESVSR